MTHPWRDIVQSRWQALTPREQRGLRWLGVLLLVVVFWQVLLAPAQNKLRVAESKRAGLAQQLQHMQAWQTQAQALQQRTPLSRDSALKALQSVTPSAGIQLNPQGERVLVTLKAVPAAVLSDWLAQARTQAQTLPSEVHLTRASNTDANRSTPATAVWDGSMVLLLPRGPASAL